MKEDRYFELVAGAVEAGFGADHDSRGWVHRAS